ncbi:MAG: AbrB/MazE/SpoVT family DNA-binding domain-containing protein [Candidatus Thermoplasmatota archaeon]|nr:AbrB/MazE/SpoVT family DNA-binding domain-containing protein [Candidatus Thermoplasmatota archaeon]
MSNQVLGEVFYATVRKFGLSADQAFTIVDGIVKSDKWRKNDYTCETIDVADRKSSHSGMHFWDAVIMEEIAERKETEEVLSAIVHNLRPMRQIPGFSPHIFMYIRVVYPNMRKVKLQKIGNSLRATIPKEVADELDIRKGQSLMIEARDGKIIMRKEGETDMSRFYGALHIGRLAGKWPTPSEMKDIWH